MPFPALSLFDPKMKNLKSGHGCRAYPLVGRPAGPVAVHQIRPALRPTFIRIHRPGRPAGRPVDMNISPAGRSLDRQVPTKQLIPKTLRGRPDRTGEGVGHVGQLPSTVDGRRGFQPGFRRLATEVPAGAATYRFWGLNGLGRPPNPVRFDTQTR